MLLALALASAIVIKQLFLQAFYIPSESMEPGLIINDRILVEKVGSWTGGDIARGDVIVFKDPGGWLRPGSGEVTGMNKALSKIGLYPTGGHLVKRVIGTAGDVITCCDDQGRLKVNGVVIDESNYIAEQVGKGCAGPRGKPNGCVSGWEVGPVPEGNVFVMGDNRRHSADSSDRMCSPLNTECIDGAEYVDVELVVGNAIALIWPRDRWARIRGADNFDEVPDLN